MSCTPDSRFRNGLLATFLKVLFKGLSALINAKLPSGFLEPLGLLFVGHLRLCLFFFSVPAFAVWHLSYLSVLYVIRLLTVPLSARFARNIVHAERDTVREMDSGLIASRCPGMTERKTLFSARSKQPDGQITKILSSPFRKNISVHTGRKSPSCPRPSGPSERGVGHRHERWDRMRWTRRCF